ncbi:MAG TPA: cytochrome c3 family protein [Anaeromyxobacteraceae bacterium]|nr:cytochrome c3 family protein [Anaeromyxobacteraceae bacterium]
MSKKRSAALAALALAAAPLAARAAGGHDAVGCAGCHSLHAAKGELIFAVPANAKYLNPKTKQAYTGSTALCLGCHQDSDKGGQGFAPISGHVSHPFGLASVNPKIARVPPELLREGGRFECLGCHDPHPSNPYYKYLRVDTKGGKDMDAFCAACHAMKADQAVASQKPVFFTSMDETGNRVMAAPAASAPKAPASPKAPGAAPAKAPAASEAKPAKKP